ncbi:MAG: tRNA preQ1(34) S-adenosylmethionine ribosyltransferase-isomerase QueA [Oscillospiraceae bacterium]|nr:tRNA preQ1(34) S-adenosylmethionine ribosyltransferase-isomerase QueA [Oscillospiraceae bacterium]
MTNGVECRRIEYSIQSVRLSDFQYELPKELIAHNPAEFRTGSRLMVVDRGGGRIIHDRFDNLVSYLRAGDCLALNDTRVMPARLLGRKVSGAGEWEVAAAGAGAGEGAAVEVLLLHKVEASGCGGTAVGGEAGESGGTAASNEAVSGETDACGEVWEALVRPGRRLMKGAKIVFDGGALNAEIVCTLASGHRLVRFDRSGAEFADALAKIGQVPLPPYIKNSSADPERYQTVYSKESGSAAAPTAGLHFTEDYLRKLAACGVGAAYLTLHIGPGTFAPVKTDDISEHRMHSEYYRVSREAAEMVNAVKAAREQANAASAALLPRLVCVGTTSIRTLESVVDESGRVRQCEGWTDIFIYPGYRFKCADALLTNFHLPGSTLLMLVCAFAGHDLAMEAYARAVESSYRFYSFGDAMLII